MTEAQKYQGHLYRGEKKKGGQQQQQRLWMPAAQLNRGSPFNNGSSVVQKPLYIYTVDIGSGPPAIDHA
jgi:hypothetical protein